MSLKNNQMDYTGFGQGEVNLFDNSVTQDKVTNNWGRDSPVLGSVVDEDYDDKKKLKTEEHLVTKNGLFILDEDGKKVNRLAKQFFSLVNSRCGGIFNFDLRSGKISKTDKNADVVISDLEQSKELAQLIYDNIGEDFAQRIVFRIVKGQFETDFDAFSTGNVDLEDVLFLGVTEKYQSTLQACLIGHFFHERINTIDYEKNKQSGLPNETHKNALAVEIPIWNNMQKDKVQYVLDQQFKNLHPETGQYDEKYFWAFRVYYKSISLYIRKSVKNGKLNYYVKKD